MAKRTLPWRKILQYGIPLFLTALWLGFIFGNSLQNGIESGNQSHRALELLDRIFAFFGWQNPISEGALRKLAHFGEFAILAILYIGDLWAFGLISLSRPLGRSVLWLCSAVPACFLAACLDETLQLFSEGRAAQFSDAMIDTSGALVASLCYFLLFLLLRRRQKKKHP